MKQYLVLGGCGFIGRSLIDRLCKDNRIIVADIHENHDFDCIENVQYKKLDFINTDSFIPLLEGVNTVIHLVSTIFAKDGTDSLEREIAENVFPTIRLLEAVSVRNIELLFLSSGGTVYGEGGDLPSRECDQKHSFCGYALTKNIIEQMVELYFYQRGLRYKTVRLSNPYGFIHNNGRTQGLIPILVERMAQGEVVNIWGDGTQIRDYIYIDDAINAILAVLDYEGSEKIFNVGFGVGYSVMDIIDLISSRLQLSSDPDIFFSKARICDVKKNILNFEKITNCTGWIPQITIEEGIDRVVEKFGLQKLRTDTRTD